MTEHNFELHFSLPEALDQPDEYLDALYESGCDDAVIGLGQRGFIALDFCRTAGSAESAIRSAVKDVKRAIPGARLITAAPDLVNLSDMVRLLDQAGVITLSRQGMRKYALNQLKKSHRTFPPSQVFAESPLWHLDDVVSWLIDNEKVEHLENARCLLDVARGVRELNASLEYARLAPTHKYDSVAALALG